MPDFPHGIAQWHSQAVVAVEAFERKHGLTDAGDADETEDGSGPPPSHNASHEMD